MYINNIKVATPKQGGVVITDEPIWASNTGRSATGKMIGDIVTWKTTVNVTWPPLSLSESKKIVEAIKNAGSYFKIKYRDFSSKEMVEKTVYVSDLPRTVYSLAKGYEKHTDLSATFIER